MFRKLFFLTACLFFVPLLIFGKVITGHIVNSVTKEPVPFVTVKFGAGNHGVVADLNGIFTLNIPALKSENITSISVSVLGYYPQVINTIESDFTIFLVPKEQELEEIVIKPPYEKINHILQTAIASKNKNNPEKYDWYQCNVYYKMTIDVNKSGKSADDTSAKEKNLREFLQNQDLFLSETYSRRTWRKPQQLQEDVLASKISGFKKAMFIGLVTDVLPFHAYSDYLKLNGKDYHNPVSRGYEQYYKFNLSNELVKDNDTIWILSFLPKGNNVNELKGTVYINSDGYAISYLVAYASDSMLQLTARLEQEYEKVTYPAANSYKWFPKQLNYIIDWTQKVNQKSVAFHMKGNSQIDSVNFKKDDNFKFDKTHTMRFAKGSNKPEDSLWAGIRPQQLTTKEVRSYRAIDSVGEENQLDKTMAMMARLPEGKFSIGIADIDLLKVFSYNDYEHIRIGAGLQTNENLMKHLSIGGFANFAFGDMKWKYGVFGELYFDPYREFAVKAAYTNDISDPGRVRISHDLDKNYLSTYLLWKADNVISQSVSLRKKWSYFGIELIALQENIKPMYKYALLYQGTELTSFNTHELSLSLRYAFGERTAPFYNGYYSTGSNYPNGYTKITMGTIESQPLKAGYLQALAAIVWHKHINRIGMEHIMLEGGFLNDKDALPLSKLFAGNGFNYQTSSGFNPSIYTFGGMMTITPYQYYSDRFVNLLYRHDFDWKLFKYQLNKSDLSFAPNFCIQYNVLYGTLAHPEFHKYVYFSVPSNVYHEAGLMLNNIFRIKYANLGYITCNLGYFGHITPKFRAEKDGNVIFGISAEL